jgi:hypothetical protein
MTNRGTWRPTWRGNTEHRLIADFDSAEDACLASEKRWPPSDEWFEGWFESRQGGYFRKFGQKPVYVRKTERGWYALRNDGRLLGQGKRVAWFGTAEEARKAVDKQWYLPAILDPFAADDAWHWIKYEKQRSLAE